MDKKSLPRLYQALFQIILVLSLYTFDFDATAQEAQSNIPVNESSRPSSGLPLTIDGEVLLYFYDSAFSPSIQDRIRFTTAAINKAAREPRSRIEMMRSVDLGLVHALSIENFIILTVTDKDAAMAGRSRADLAEEYLGLVRGAVLKMHESYSRRGIVLAILKAVFVLILLAVMLRLLSLLLTRIYGWLERRRTKLLQAMGVTEKPDSGILSPILTLLKVIHFLVFLILVLGSVYMVLDALPWTRDYSFSVLRYFRDPLEDLGDSFIAFLPDLASIIVLVLFSYIIIKVLKVFFAEIRIGGLKFPGFYPDWAEPTFRLFRFMILILTAVAIFPYIPGSDSDAFKGIGLFVGLLVSLGSTGAMANVIAGFGLTYTRAFHLGDVVRIGDAFGTVSEKTLLVTRIRTNKNVQISVPNATVVSSHVINYSAVVREKGYLILHTSVTIGYDAPWRVVHKLLTDSALQTESICRDPAPFVLQKSLDDFYVTYEINAYSNAPGKIGQIYSQLHENIQDKFNEAGVEIMSPHYRSERDGSRSTIPAEYRALDAKVPSIQPALEKSK